MAQRKIFFCFFCAIIGLIPLFAQPQLTGVLGITSVNGYSIQMVLVVSNIGDQPFIHTFTSTELSFYSMDGIVIHSYSLPDEITVTLEPGESFPFHMRHYDPLSSGSHSIQAYLNIMDNEGNFMAMGAPQIVMIGSSIPITFGSGDALSLIPIDFYWRTTLYECVFSTEELEHTAGWVTAISFYNNFSQETFSNQQISIYLANVTQSNLAEDWIRGVDFVLVFNGLASFPVGDNEINLPLSWGFYYLGYTNLALLVYRPIPGSYQTLAEPFLAQASDPLRSRKYVSDSLTHMPWNPPNPVPSQHIAFMPKTTFHIIPNSSQNNDEHATPSAITSTLYPNPVRSECTIKLSTVSPESANLEIFNLRGQKISSLKSPAKNTEHIMHWDTLNIDGKPCPSGVYFYRISCGKNNISKKLILLRQ